MTHVELANDDREKLLTGAAYVLRVIVQLVLAAPVIIVGTMFYGTAGTAGIRLFDFGDTPATVNGILAHMLFVAGFCGILTLPFSIFIPASYVRKKRWLRVILATGLTAGSIAAVFFLVLFVINVAHVQDLLGGSFFILWLFGGPLAVAIWNMVRYFEKPSQPPESPPSPGTS